MSFDTDTMANSVLEMRRRLKAANAEIARLEARKPPAPIVVNDTTNAEALAEARKELQAERAKAKREIKAAAEQATAARNAASGWHATAQRHEARCEELSAELAALRIALRRALK